MYMSYYTYPVGMKSAREAFFESVEEIIFDAEIANFDMSRVYVCGVESKICFTKF